MQTYRRLMVWSGAGLTISAEIIGGHFRVGRRRQTIVVSQILILQTQYETQLCFH